MKQETPRCCSPSTVPKARHRNHIYKFQGTHIHTQTHRPGVQEALLLCTAVPPFQEKAPGQCSNPGCLPTFDKLKLAPAGKSHLDTASRPLCPPKFCITSYLCQVQNMCVFFLQVGQECFSIDRKQQKGRRTETKYTVC